MEPRESFVFDRTIYEVSKILPYQKKMQFLKSVVEYGIYGEIPKIDRDIYPIFGIAKRLIDLQNEDGRTSAKYRKWKKSVLERDSYTCQICGKRCVQLNVHHIKEWSKYPELRFDMKNGISLCDDCHKILHKKRNK